MKKIANRKHVLIVGIIFLLSTGIILSSNWNYFVKNNESNNSYMSSYQISGNNANHINYIKEQENIMFQINVLKSAIKENNIMYKQYNSIFRHNINYIRLQKNSIKNKILTANSSITHELVMINNMKKIVSNHPYNYLKFFQSKNYTLSEIVSQNTHNYNSTLNNIKTIDHVINKSNTSVKNISYQSEEASIGIGSISSIISSSKMLIFSKVHFNYNNIFYFSSYKNNLSTINNKTKNMSNNAEKTNSVYTTQFITNSSYGKNASDQSSTLNSHHKKIFNSSNLFSLVSDYYYLSKHKNEAIAVGVILPITLVSGLAVSYWALLKRKLIKNVIKKLNIKINTQSKQGEDDTVNQTTRGTSLLSNNEDFAAEVHSDGTPQNNSVLHLDNTPSRDGATDGTSTNYPESDIVVKSKSKSSISGLNREELSPEVDATKTKTLKFINDLYDKKIADSRLISRSQFKEQLISYAFVRKNTIETNNPDITITMINSLSGILIGNKQRAISSGLSPAERELVGYNPYTLKAMTLLDINRDNEEISQTETTTYGWFNKPNLKPIDTSNLTNEEKLYIKSQLNEYMKLKLRIPKVEDIMTRNIPEELIMRQIFSDLNEIIQIYDGVLFNGAVLAVVKEVNQSSTPAEASSGDVTKIDNYITKLESIRTVRKNTDLSHINVTDEDIANWLGELTRLRG